MNMKKEYLIKISVESNFSDDRRPAVAREIVKNEDDLDDVSDIWEVICSAVEEFEKQI